MNFINKNFKTTLIIFTIMLFVSCEDDQISNDIYEAKNNNYPNITTYLNNEYPSGYRFGNSREFNSNGNTFVVKEVFKSSSSQVNAFINLTNGDFTHFLELDRTNNSVIIEDFGDQTTYRMAPGNIDIFEPGFLVGIDEPEVVTNRFWGWECGPEQENLNGDCIRRCSYYVFWGRFDHDFDGELTEQHPCDDLPGNSPSLDP